MEAKLCQEIETVWDKVTEAAKSGAVFYLDSGAAHLLKLGYPGGPSGLLRAGALTVCQLEEEDSRPTGPLVPLSGGNVVVICTDYLFNYEDRINEILHKGGFIDCQVLCSLTEQAHSLAKDHDQPFKTFSQYKALYEEWMAAGQRSTTTSNENTESPVERDDWGNDWGEGTDWDTDVAVVATVSSIPLYGFLPLPSTLSMPAFDSFFPLCPLDTVPISAYLEKQMGGLDRLTGAQRINLGDINDVNIHMLPPLVQKQYHLLAATLLSMLNSLELQVECFVAGHSAQLLVRELRALQMRAQGGVKEGREEGKLATLIVVDRTVDIAGPLFRSDSLADRIINTVSDSQVDMQPVLPLPINKQDINDDAGDPIIDSYMGMAVTSTPIIGSESVGGDFIHPGDAIAGPLLADMIMMKERNALQQLRKVLVTTMTKDKIPMRLQSNPGRVTDKQLLTFLDALKKAGMSSVEKHTHLIQVALATIQAMQTSQNGTWDELLAAQKELLMCAYQGTDSTGLFIQLIDMLEDSRLTVMDVLQLILFMVGVMGDLVPVDKQEEEILRYRLANRAITGLAGNTMWAGAANTILDNQSLEDSDTKLSILDDVLAVCIKKLRSLSGIRMGYTITRSLLTQDDFTTTSTPYKPWLATILETTLVKQQEVPELQHQSFTGGLRSKIYSGFNRFMATKPRPMDQSDVIVLVLGGITTAEIRCITEIVSGAKGYNVLLVTTGFSTAENVLKNVIFSDQKYV